MHSSLEHVAVVRSQGASVHSLADLGPRVDPEATARLDGYRAGRTEGFAAGHADGQALAERAVLDALEGLRSAAADLEARSADAAQDLASFAMHLAVELAEAIVGGDLSLLETGEDVILRALSLRRAGETVRIRVHPAHPLLAIGTTRPDVEVVADPDVAPDQAFAEIGEGLADLSIATAVTRVREVLA